jgi:hypothetical protein
MIFAFFCVTIEKVTVPRSPDKELLFQERARKLFPPPYTLGSRLTYN